jgi:hypothetical protein
MGSKLKPGDYDAYNMALPDEPMFVLIARDPSAPNMLRIWSDTRRKLVHARAEAGDIDDAAFAEGLRKCSEADACADDMVIWRKVNEGRWREGSDLRPRLGDPSADELHLVEQAVARHFGYALGVASQFHGVIEVTAHKVRPWRSPLFAGRVHAIELTCPGRCMDYNLDQLHDIRSLSVQGMIVADLAVLFHNPNTIDLAVSVVLDA